jgi:hypothetical protein
VPGGAPTPAGRPPFTDVGSVVGLSPGETNYLDLALSPGTYAFLCYFPDKTHGAVPHFLEGMATVATVS